MPRIVVTTNADEDAEPAVLMSERVTAADLDSDLFSAQLVERVGWALLDADEVERGTGAIRHPNRVPRRESNRAWAA